MKLCTIPGYCLTFWVETLVVMSEFDRGVRGLQKKKVFMLCRYHIGRHAANLQVANTYEGTNVSDIYRLIMRRY